MIRRLFVAVLALVLSVTVLAVSPAGAANTAVESLVDHDNDAATAQVRAFGRVNRYATSVALAEAFRANSGSGGFVDTVIVASGESLVDAAAATGLAAAESAPVLLTTPGRLQRAVENFIVDEFISEVFIVGGVSSVSQSVEDAITALAPVRTVTRLAGTDRYGTAVAVAGEIGSPGVYCDSGLVTALLVNVDSSFSDVIAVGPLAYSLGLPILLTPANELPASVATYLTDAEIESVVVIGGAASVSEAVVGGINNAGVEDVVRISGANRYDTALEIRQALSDCSTVTLSPNTIALVNAEAAADGVSAGPLLGLGLANNGVTPVLLVDGGGDSGGLPADTRDFLRSLPARNADASFVDVSLTAIGGTAVVPESVVQAAIAAATTSPPITATITATTGSNTVTVTFSAPVNVAKASAGAADFATSALNHAHYQVAGGPLVLFDTLVASNSNRTITITLSGNVPLTPNAEISVAGDKIKGFGGDNRLVASAQATARVLPADRVRPRIEVFAPQGSHAIRIRVTEPNLATDVSTQTDDQGAETGEAATTTTRQALLANIRIGDAPLYVAPPSSAPDGTTSTSVARILPSSAQSAQNDITVCLFGMTGASGSEVCDTAPASPPGPPAVDDGNPRVQEALKTGETITIAAGAFEDDQGNPSRSTTQRVTSYSNYPRVTRATVTSATTLDVAAAGADPDPQVAQWRWLRYDAATPPEVDTNVLTITAKPGGAAGGAGGNDWRVSWNQLPADTDTDPKATVSVNERRKIILINFDEDATIFTVAGALASSPVFSELFTVNSDAFVDGDFAQEKITATDNLLPTGTSVTPCSDAPVADGVCGRPSTDVSRALSGGVSVVAVTLTYNETLNSFNYAGTADTTGTAGLIATNENADAFPSQQRTVPGTRGQQLTLGWQPDPFTADLDLDNEFRFLLTTDSPTLADLPKPGNRISLPAGLGETFAFVNDTPATDPLCPSGLSANSDDDPCGRSIAAITPGQTLRRSTTSGRIEGGETIVLNAIATTVRTTGEGAQTFTVSFAEAVNDESDDTAAAFAASAANPAHYLISSAALPATATIALSADSLTATITLPVGSELALGDTIAVIGGTIAAANTAGLLNDAVEVVVTATGVEPATPITATITATVGGRIITVRFSEAVSGALSVDGLATSARNPNNYQIDGVSVRSRRLASLSADGLVASIALLSGGELVDGGVVSIVGGQIKAANDERRVQAATLTVSRAAPALITATIEPLVAGEQVITVRFSEPVNSAADGTDGFASSARNPASYRIDRFTPNIDREGGSIVLSDNDMTATITLSTDLELFESQRFVVGSSAFSSTGIKAAGANDDRRVDPTQVAVGPAPTTRITAAIAAQVNSNTILVDFSEPVSNAASGTGARNPAHYQIDSAALPGTTTIALSSDGLVATVTLPAGSEVATGAVITIAGGEISVAAASDDRRVAAAEFTVGTLITATIEPVAASPARIFFTTTSSTIEFSERVNSALPGEAGYASSARNLANYQIDGIALGSSSSITNFTDSEVSNNIRVTLSALVLDEGQVISVVGGAIKAENASDSRTVEAAEVTVGPQLPLEAAIEARAGERTITVSFSSSVNGAASGEDGFAGSARNPAHYRIDGTALPEGTTITSQFNFLATITLPAGSELINGAVISVVGGEIQARSTQSDSRTVEATSFTVGTTPTPITATISAEADERTITVVFSEGVEGALSGFFFSRSARNPAHYQIDDAPLPEGTFITLTPDGITATITLPVGEELAEGAVIIITGDAIFAAGIGFITDFRTVEATTFTVPAS